MSVVLGFLSPTCVTLACDGRTSWRQPDGSLKPSREHYKKIAMLGSGKAAVGMTGSSVLDDALVPELDAAAREMSFDELVAFTAKTAKTRLLELSRTHIIEGIAILLAGIVEGKPRMVYIGSQDNFVPDEIVNPAGKCGVCSLGGDASEPIRDKAFELLEAGMCPLPKNAGQFCETVIQGMSRQFAHTINANTWSITLSPGMNYETHRPIPAEPEVLVGTEADGLTRVALAATHAAGNVAYNFKGAWSSATSYVIGDEVTSGNIYWIALAPNTNSQPSISNGNWQAVGRIEGDVQIFTSSGTWSKPAAGTFAVITCIGGGSGGSGGGKNTAGNGGFAGGISVQTLPLSILGATESVTIGGGGNGGAGSTVASSNPGGSGGTTSFGSWLRAGGGTSSAAGGGNMDNGTLSMQGGNGGNGGGPPNNGSNGADGATARTNPFAGGGGGTGALNLSGNATASPGGNGTAASTDEPAGGGGGGGGGGASCGTSSFTATGGNGGNAAIYGAGGGGGGGAASNGAAQGGSGGGGAPGILIVAVY